MAPKDTQLRPGGKRATPQAPAGADAQEPSTFNTLVGGAVKGANGIVSFVRDHHDDPAAPFEYLDNLRPAPLKVVMDSSIDDLAVGGGTVGFQIVENAWNKAVDFVSQHGKKDPNAAAQPTELAMGGNGKLPNNPPKGPKGKKGGIA